MFLLNAPYTIRPLRSTTLNLSTTLTCSRPAKSRLGGADLPARFGQTSPTTEQQAGENPTLGAGSPTMLGVSEDTVYEMMTNDELDALGRKQNVMTWTPRSGMNRSGGSGFDALVLPR